MRFHFNLAELNEDDSRRSSTPKEELHWVPLQNHPVFTSAEGGATIATVSALTRGIKNLLAWDGASRLYYWDSNKQCLHRISTRLGEPDPTSVVAASPSKVLRADKELNFVVNKISINRNGSALLLAGSDDLCIMFLYGRSSTKDNAIICRTVSVGSQVYSSESSAIRILQVSWHPNSDSHVGILSSDSVFRLFDLFSDVMQLEQEYYLQPVEPGRSRNAASICPVDFSFGGDHLWDRFSVFVLFSDGAVYILCPVVPFGSVYKWESILEIYSDAHTFGLNSANSAAVCNSNMAISWLEETFPELAQQAADTENPSTIKAHSHALFDASLALQGPLHKVCRAGEDEALAVRGAECEGRAVSFIYNLVSKDSILVTAWSGGQLQIDALADEIQPVWVTGSAPRLRVDSHDHVRGIAMICESITAKHSIVKLDQPLHNTVWLGHPPPLLRLAIVDLALPRKTEGSSLITMFVDPLMPERIYSLHEGGVDSIVLHFLPFTSQINGKDENIKTPSVHPVLSTCQGETSLPSPLFGFTSLSDSFGYSWVVLITSTEECVVLEMKTWNLLLPIQIDQEKPVSLEEQKEKDTPDIISKELLSGPKSVLVPHASPNLHSISADSIEGRSALHQYFKLFHENYVEYAHKVYFELKHHGPQLKRIIDDQHTRLNKAQENILRVEAKQSMLNERIDRAVQRHGSLEQRLQHLRRLPGVQKKPLSRAEQEFKSELDQFAGVELDALKSSINTLKARLRRYTQSSKDSVANQRRKMPGRNNVQDTQISQLRSSLEKLSLLNSESTKKVELVESALKMRDSS
ncbi:Nuclear pore complex protein NUP88 [Hibiscus syriacus]|uniref:Nuclear pore complex protein NUP88 n=1 Tax=Hibiscus syriacus TaxID=106335 RepID=A0A6A3BL64_HIBSY|nr:nuclear pore complex protein NUP88-like [Hibiscus syriacus]KAE8717746.1 Nuclear pore complex protein NUP88 [Hibiscus syriacus]